MSGRPVPLAVWTAVLSGGAVLLCTATTGVALAAGGALTTGAAEALAAGALCGLALVTLHVVLAARLGTALRRLRRSAVQRLQDPAAPLERSSGRPLVTRASTELAGLHAVLEALHVRVRLGDQVGERHRRDAETAGAGVFELLSGLVAAEEGARGQLAAELHDTVAQSLMAARSLLAAGPHTPDRLVAVADHVEDAEEQVRAVMARTRPPALREGDLATAVEHLRLDMQARYALSVDLVWPPTAHPLPLASAITVYRFLQEALLNVVKHADVEHADVELAVEERLVRATVRDAGPGFDPAAVRSERGRHVGLGLLRERARLSGGSLRVTSVLGSGTTLVLELPRPASPGRVPRQAGPYDLLRVA